ncbi:MAG: bifunctional 2-polyprenyl-6-hydroxyphenol methylase/3-demethylubiquinol 3-O-methyltransferase UbiG [Gammaproteobacteria bacterium]|nr:bifunctional 2-polyprenyl-6-hydroxyphenol methylase/3-demethylubiquinol 3-O-methyltransferase UbiG [Gammaproteobacteria bacterium]MDH3448215.1 bifunctional 2-polyprenyl-6-hydroxyphenol methylase/3-demethylubiquinol 3-O-methyltransferase UbiG [Gammaproteobacteria bacterium]
MKSSTIDPQEVAYYERLAEQWWDRQGKFWPLHRLNELRVDYLKRAICDHFGRNPDDAMPLAGIAIVDIGCGGGILSESMAALGARVLGIDVVEKNISVARQHSLNKDLALEYRHLTVEDLADSGERFDVVLNMEVVEHVQDLALFMAACNRLVADRGMMFVATINRNPVAWLIAIFGAEYVLGWLPRGTHSYRKLVRPGELKRLLELGTMRVIDSAGVGINPLSKRFSLSGRLTVNYMLAAVRAETDQAGKA